MLNHSLKCNKTLLRTKVATFFLSQHVLAMNPPLFLSVLSTFKVLTALSQSIHVQLPEAADDGLVGDATLEGRVGILRVRRRNRQVDVHLGLLQESVPLGQR